MAVLAWILAAVAFAVATGCASLAWGYRDARDREREQVEWLRQERGGAR